MSKSRVPQLVELDRLIKLTPADSISRNSVLPPLSVHPEP